MLENNTFRLLMYITGVFVVGGAIYYLSQHYGSFQDILNQFSSYRLQKY